MLLEEISIILKFPSPLHSNFNYTFSDKTALKNLKDSLELRQKYLGVDSDTLALSDFVDVTSISPEDINKNEAAILEFFEKSIEPNMDKKHSLKYEIQYYLRNTFNQWKENKNYPKPKIFICCDDPLLDSYPWRKLEMFKVQDCLEDVEIVLSPFDFSYLSKFSDYINVDIIKILTITDPNIDFGDSLDMLNQLTKDLKKIQLFHNYLDVKDLDQIWRSLEEVKPHILILMGHSKEYILLDGSHIEDTKHYLKEAVKDGLAISIVNSCASLLIGREMSRFGVRHVVAMSWPIKARSANGFFKHLIKDLINKRTNFSSSFHSAIGKFRLANKEFPAISLNPVIYEHIPYELSLDFKQTVDKLHNEINQTYAHIENFKQRTDDNIAKLNSEMESVKTNIKLSSDHITRLNSDMESVIASIEPTNDNIAQLNSDMESVKNNFWTTKIFSGKNNFLLAVIIAISSLTLIGYVLFLLNQFRLPAQNLQSNKDEKSSIDTSQNATQNPENSIVQVRKNRNNTKITLTGFIFHKNSKTGNHYFITTNYGQSPDDPTLKVDDFQANAYKVSIDEVNSTDIAIFEFQVCGTNKDFKMIDFANPNEIKTGSTLYVFGMIPSDRNSTNMIHTFIPVQIINKDKSPTTEGYSLSYSLRTRKSMNGSPLLTSGGKLAGMHAVADSLDITQVQPLVQENKDIEADSFRFAQGVSLDKLQGIRSKVEEFDLKNTKSCK